MRAGEHEYESYQLLYKRGHTPERLNDDAISRRFPAWKQGAFVDGFFHAQGSYVESGRVVAALIRLAQSKGVMLYPDQTVAPLVEESTHIKGVRTRSGNTYYVEHVVVASGSIAILRGQVLPWQRVTVGMGSSSRPSWED